MPSQDKLFLTASVNSSNSLTGLFDFAWPTSVALWNLQWQAKGFLAQVPEATVQDLHSRFIAGSGVRGANLKRLAEETAWSDAQQWFARLLLSETCALFEGWIESALDELAIPATIRKLGKNSLDKKLQFPTRLDSAGVAVGGVMDAVNIVRGINGSPFIASCLTPILKTNTKNCEANLESLLSCYRAFKELRNDFVHHGGVASDNSELAFSLYAAETPATLGLKEMPELFTVVSGKTIALSIRGVVGFSDVVLRLIATLDCLLANSIFAEQELERRWIAKHRGRITVAGFGPSRDAHLIKLIRQCRMPKPVALPAAFTHLFSKGLVV